MGFEQVNCFKTKIDRLVIWRFDNTIWYNIDVRPKLKNTLFALYRP